jgi:hypothetical protein
MVATINSLPLELIRLILDFAPLPLPDEYESGRAEESFPFYRAGPRVLRLEVDIASVAVEYVYLESPVAVAAFIQAPRLPIKTLRIYFDDPKGPEQVSYRSSGSSTV